MKFTHESFGSVIMVTIYIGSNRGAYVHFTARRYVMCTHAKVCGMVMLVVIPREVSLFPDSPPKGLLRSVLANSLHSVSSVHGVVIAAVVVVVVAVVVVVVTAVVVIVVIVIVVVVLVAVADVDV